MILRARGALGHPRAQSWCPGLEIISLLGAFWARILAPWAQNGTILSILGGPGHQSKKNTQKSAENGVWEFWRLCDLRGGTAGEHNSSRWLHQGFFIWFLGLI